MATDSPERHHDLDRLIAGLAQPELRALLARVQRALAEPPDAVTGRGLRFSNLGEAALDACDDRGTVQTIDPGASHVFLPGDVAPAADSVREDVRPALLAERIRSLLTVRLSVKGERAVKVALDVTGLRGNAARLGSIDVLVTEWASAAGGDSHVRWRSARAPRDEVEVPPGRTVDVVAIGRGLRLDVAAVTTSLLPPRREESRGKAR
jgi:hypothetical protein